MNGNRIIIPSIIIAFGLIICAVILVLTWKSNYSSNQTITITGSAKEDIVFDLAILKGTLTARAPTAEGAIALQWSADIFGGHSVFNNISLPLEAKTIEKLLRRKF